MASGLRHRLDTARSSIATFVRANPLRALIIVLVCVGAAPRLWAMWFDQGTFWPDEIFQSIEQGHRLAFGYGYVPWEFDKGARSWVFPGFLGGVLKLGAILDSAAVKPW